MLENLAYPIIGFVFTYLALETAWHFAVCRIHDPKLQPCVFKEVQMLVVAHNRRS
jgi:hypothetical protein